MHVQSQSESMEIQPPLKNWINHPFTTSWFYDTNSTTLFYKVSSLTYNVYEPVTHSRRSNTTSITFTATSQILPPSFKPAIVNRINPFHPVLESVIDTTNTFEAPPRYIDRHANIFMKQISFPSNVEQLVSQIINWNAVAVTDASLSPYSGIGASLFTITTTNLQTACCGSHGVPKGSAPIDSYCAELYGIYAIMVCLQYLIDKYNIQ